MALANGVNHHSIVARVDHHRVPVSCLALGPRSCDRPNALKFPVLVSHTSHWMRLSTFKNKAPTLVSSSNADAGSSDEESVPLPIVHIDQDSDHDATVVTLSFGDRLEALVDTMNALKDLGLDVVKGSLVTQGPVKETVFYITESVTGRKIKDPEKLEKIRLTIINKLLEYHPESSERLAMGATFGVKAPPKKPNAEIVTNVHIKSDGPKRSLLYVETADRPGLLVEIIKIINDVNIDVESAEIDTEGLIAKDTFHVSYRDEALNNSLSQVLVNCLRYYLRRAEADIDSY